MTWVLSRQFEADETYATKTSALLKEAALRLRGITCLVWEMRDEVGPFQPEPFTSSSTDENLTEAS